MTDKTGPHPEAISAGVDVLAAWGVLGHFFEGDRAEAAELIAEIYEAVTTQNIVTSLENLQQAVAPFMVGDHGSLA